MKIHILVTAVIVSVALASPAEAASKKKKKGVHRAPIGAVYSNRNAYSNRDAYSSYDVYVSGELIGRDPDPSIRAFMIRNPHIWDAPN
jgi:hypothetical protein